MASDYREHRDDDRLDVHWHLHGPLAINVNVNVTLRPYHRPARGTRLTLGGSPMPGKITVDTTTETATFEFTDDHGNVTQGPDGAVVNFTTDDPNIATIAPSADAPLVGQITPAGTPGTVNISATVTAADGSPLMEADGTTPFPQPDPQPLEVDPGAAVGDRLTLS